jgi:cyclohexadieny/prephenate dehydrogenase
MVEEMDPDHHDLVLAIVSHLPHIIAYNIVGTADDLETVTKSEVIKYSASGFRDFTRSGSLRSGDVAGRLPCTTRTLSLKCWRGFPKICHRCSGRSAGAMETSLFELFTRTRGIRRSIIEAGQDTDVPNFGRNIHKADESAAE